jgi:hypothetical protein
MNDTRTYPNTQTFLIEASREDSLIDNKDNNDFNSKWTTETNFNLKRGDTVSVEMVALNAQNAGSSQSIEFTGEQVIVDGKKRAYCDNKVLLEIFFYMNNNNTYTVGLPLKHPEGSFDDTTYSAQTYMPTTQGLDTGGHIPNVRGLTMNPGSMSFLGIGVVGSGPGAYVGPVMDATKAHFCIGFILDDGTTVTTATATDLVESFILGKAGDTNPKSGQATDYAGWLKGDGTANKLCNILPLMMWGVEDDAGNLEINSFVIKDLAEQGGTGRLVVNLVEPTYLAPAPNTVSAGALFALNWNVETLGSSEVGLVNYDNINPASFNASFQPAQMAKNANLSNYMENIGYTATAMSGQFKAFNNAIYGSATSRDIGNVAKADINNPAAARGFRCQNPRYNNNSKPYIFTRNDWCGQGRRQPNSGKFLPKLEPLSTFILLEADELFTDVNSLAQKINDKLHETLNLFDTEIPEQDNYLTNTELYPNPISKASSVIPYSNNYGYLDPAESTGFTEVQYNLWDTIPPIKFGGTVKIQPANFDDGVNYLASGDGTSGLNKSTDVYFKTTYINKVTNQTFYPEKVENPIYGNCGYGNFFKAQLGDRWSRLDCQDMITLVQKNPSPAIGDRCIGRPVILNNKLKYTSISVQNRTGSSNVTSTVLDKHQLIFTNIQYPTIDGTGNVDPPAAPDKFADFAEQVRKYEIYNNKSGPKDYNKQDKTIDWCFDFDLGITNDSDTSFLDNVPSTTAKYNPMVCKWTDMYPATADPSDTFGTGQTGTTRPLIHPVFSCERFGGGDKWDYRAQFQAYRPLGKILIESRFDNNYVNTSIQISDQATTTPSVTDPRCELIDAELYKEQNVVYPDIELMKKLNLGCYPYTYTDEDGNKLILTAVRVAVDYHAIDLSPSSLNIGALTWGLPIGVSQSAVDNHIIAPMNADFRDTDIIYDSGAQPKLNRYLRYNRINQVWTGANNPTFQFNSDKNRYEFINLQSDQLLSSFNTAQAGGGVSSQLGDKVGIVNTVTKDAVFSAETNQSEFTKGVRDAIGGVGVYNIWLCPPDYTPPEGISLHNYWDNSTIGQTALNHDAITAGCTKATREMWEGNLLDRCGFDYYGLFPRYGRQFNRFDPATYNNEDPNLVGNGVKPLILNNSLDNVTNPSLSVYYDPIKTPASGAIPTGVPNFGHSINANLPVLLSTQSLPLTAKNSPVLTTSPFYIIYSDVVGERNYQSGSTPLPAVFYCMRNYSASGFFYGYGSSFQIMVNQDRALSLINTEIRNPNGELAKLSKNSTIMYKIQRQSIIPPPMIDVYGQLENQVDPDPNNTELLNLTRNNVSGGVAGGTGDRIKPGRGRGSGRGPGIRSGNGTVTHIPTVILNNSRSHIQPGGQVVGSASHANEIATQTNVNTSIQQASNITPELLDEYTEGQAFGESIAALFEGDAVVDQATRDMGSGIAGDTILPEQLKERTLDRKVISLIFRVFLAKLTEKWAVKDPNNQEDIEYITDFFPVSIKKGDDFNTYISRGLRQLFQKLDIGIIFENAQNDPAQLIDFLMRPADETNPAGLLVGININAKGQVTYDALNETPISHGKFYLEAINDNQPLAELYDVLADSAGKLGKDITGLKNYAKIREKVKMLLDSDDIVGVYVAPDGKRYVYENISNWDQYGEEGTGFAYPLEEVEGNFTDVNEARDELGEIEQFIVAGRGAGKEIPISRKAVTPDLQDYLMYLNSNLVPDSRFRKPTSEGSGAVASGLNVTPQESQQIQDAQVATAEQIAARQARGDQQPNKSKK